MTDAAVEAAIGIMEAWLADPAWAPDPEQLDRWQADFQAALALAEKAAGWPDLVRRAHGASARLEARIAVLTEARDQMRSELEAQDRGQRALKGYGANAR